MAENKCSFISLVGGYCGFDGKDRKRSTEIIALVECDRDVTNHKSSFSFTGVENEIDLILSRACMFTRPRNVDSLTICPHHRASLGISWKRSSTKCCVPVNLSGHSPILNKKPKAQRGLSKSASELVLRETGVFLAIGSGVCSACRILLSETRESVPTVNANIEESKVAQQFRHISLDSDEMSGLSVTATQSTPASLSKYAADFSTFMTPDSSLYSPSPASVAQCTCTPLSPRPEKRRLGRSKSSALDKMNDFLEEKDVSPVRHPMRVPWEEASERTKRRHVRKARQVVNAVLDEVAPNQQYNLWRSLVTTDQMSSGGSDSEEDNVDKVLMDALAECYNNASTWEIRRQILSIMADKLSFKGLKKWIPDLTRYRFSVARKHVLLHGRGVPPESVHRTKMFVSPTQLDHFLDFITSPHVIQDLPFGERSIKTSTKEVVVVPNVIRLMIPEAIVRQYLVYAEECDFKPLSRRTLLNILSVCSASVRKSLQGLDYISSAGAQAFDDLCDVVDRLGEEFMGMSWIKEEKEQLKSAKRYLKTDFKVHVSKQSTIADHCRQYALSDPTDKDFQVVCTHDHLDICDRCNALTSALAKLNEAIDKMVQYNVDTDTREELTFMADQATANIKAWKAHLLRSVNQDEARLDILEMMNDTSVLLVQDWAMKFLPRKYRESQTDWFGKRGLSWHITVAIRKVMPNQELQMMTFAHVFKSCSQDSSTVVAITADVIGKLKAIIPTLQTVYYRQDNAGCYRSGTAILGALNAAQLHDVQLQSFDFCDPQGGKGACDRKAATIKAHMRIYLNEGNDIENAQQMVDAMKSSGGVPGLSATLCDSVCGEASHTKLDGVSTVANVVYGADSLCVWKAYGIGPGKKIPYAKLRENNEASLPKLSINEHEEICAKFTNPKFRHKSSSRSQSLSSATEEPVDGTEAYCHLFPCPEEGCVKTYQRLSSLQHHLDCGKHERILEHETLMDKAVHGYADRLEQQFTSVPHIQQRTSTLSKTGLPSLQMGWALKTSRSGRSRFTEKQKDYLTSKFLMGENTGQKMNASSVAKSMVTARDRNGERLFASTEFLTAQQVTSFFSRLGSKRALQRRDTPGSEDEDDDDGAQTETVYSELREEVIAAVQPVHPIYYDNFNLCEMMAQSKLATFAIVMLQNICDKFDIDASDIKLRRKAPYIEKLECFLRKCSCHSQ